MDKHSTRSIGELSDEQLANIAGGDGQYPASQFTNVCPNCGSRNVGVLGFRDSRGAIIPELRLCAACQFGWMISED